MSERTQDPTPRRLQEARAEGQVALSRELNSAVVMLVGIWLLGGPGKKLVTDLNTVMIQTVSAIPSLARGEEWIGNIILNNLIQFAPGLGLLLMGLLVAGVSVTLIQTRFLWAGKRIGVDLDRLNPLNGFRRILSKQGIVEFIRAFLKLLVIGGVTYAFLRSHSHEITALGKFDLQTSIRQWAELARRLALQVSAAYLILAIVDYAYQYWQNKKSLLMTREEVKEDLKRSEGDPFIRRKIRSQQRRLARQRMMANVPQADVIITNPTHLALAVQYEAESMNAPILLAKGAYRTAERIVALAKSHNIHIVQNIPLAHTLYQNVEVDQEIPSELYVAIAEVLAYIYSLNNKSQSSVKVNSINNPSLPRSVLSDGPIQVP